MARRFTQVIEGLPATVPFVAPDLLERRAGRPLRVRLGANESGFGISPRAQEAMRRAVEESWCYGDPESWDLRVRLAALNNTDPAHLVVAAGIDDLLGMVVRAFAEPREIIVSSHGAYPTFAYHVKAYGALLHTVPYLDDRNDLDALADTASATGARILYLANPDNPTGSFHRPEDIAAFADKVHDGCILILDEAYSDFVPPDGLPAIPCDHPRVIRMRTFSKAHGLAGARIGYAIAAPDVIAAFDKFRLHFGVNRVAQAGALASLDDPGFLASVVAGVEEGRREYEALGEKLGMRALPSLTNFVAFDTGDGARARALLARLLEDGVFIRMPMVPPLDRLIRVTVGTAVERAAFGEAIERIR